MAKTLPALTVDKAGLGRSLARRGIEFCVLELIQNAFDEDVKNVSVLIGPAGRGLHEVTVEDDSPDGWRDLDDAHCLFADSYKKDNPLKRGKFNMGEKLVVALARKARLVTTTGGWEWEGDSTVKSRRASIARDSSRSNCQRRRGSSRTSEKKEKEKTMKLAQPAVSKPDIDFAMMSTKRHIRRQKTRDTLRALRTPGLHRGEVLSVVRRLGTCTTSQVGQECGLPPQLQTTGARQHLNALVADGVLAVTVTESQTLFGDPEAIARLQQ